MSGMAASEAVQAGGLELPPLIVTRSAAEYIENVKASRKVEQLWLRVSVLPGGCGGHQYGLEFQESGPGEGDRVVEGFGARVIVDERSLGLVEGSTLDYTTTMMESALAITANPNADSGCGCGTSFAVKDESF